MDEQKHAETAGSAPAAAAGAGAVADSVPGAQIATGEAEGRGGGFMTSEDEEKERALSIKHKASTSSTTLSEKSPGPPPTTTVHTDDHQDRQAAATAGSQQERPSTPPDRAAAAPVQPGTPTVSSTSVQSSSGTSRFQPQRKSSPPPTPPARLSGSSSSNSYRSNTVSTAAYYPSTANKRPPSDKSGSPANGVSGTAQQTRRAVSRRTERRQRGERDGIQQKQTLAASQSTLPSDTSPSVSTGQASAAEHDQGASSSSHAAVRRRSSSPGARTASPQRTATSPGSPPLLAERSSSPASSAASGSASSSSPPPPEPTTMATMPTSQPSRRRGERQPPPPPVLRRVKVYVLYDANWIDLGTGSCTFHRGVAHRLKKRVKRRRISSLPRTILPADEYPSEIERDFAKAEEERAAAEGLLDDAEYGWQEEVKLSEIRVPRIFRKRQGKGKQSGRGSGGRKPEGGVDSDEDLSEDSEEEISSEDEDAFRDLLEPGEEEVAWLEVVKEGRWKIDPDPSTSRKRKRKTKGPAPSSTGSRGAQDSSTASKILSKKQRKLSNGSVSAEGTVKASSPSTKEASRDDSVVSGEGRNDAGSDTLSSDGSDSESSDSVLETADSSEEENVNKFDKTWMIRLEKPEPYDDGSFNFEACRPQRGPEEGEETIGRYRRQQDTLIVWKTSAGLHETFGLGPDARTTLPGLFGSASAKSGQDDDEPPETELALSFAATAACAQVWRWLQRVHDHWLDQFLETPEGKALLLGNKLGPAGADALSSTDASARNSTASTSNTSTAAAAAAAGYGLGLGPLGQSQVLILEPSMAMLDEIEQTLLVVSRTSIGKEKLANVILRTNFLKKLVPIFKEAEDLESLRDLHQLCCIVQTVLSLNDHALWDCVLADDIFFDIISMLEYDVEFGEMKASYRAHLSDPSLYVEVVPIRDPQTKLKIHQTYRLQYLKDVILPRTLDDAGFAVINSVIYFHQVDIVQYLNQNESFWRELFDGVFTEPASTSASTPSNSANSNGKSNHHEKQHDAVAFLQSYCQMIKQLQPGMRMSAFKTLSERGLPRVIAFSLNRMAPSDLHIRVATVEILLLLVDHDPSSIRAFVLKDGEGKGKRSLLSLIIETFHKEEDLGIKAQLSEAIRVLLIPPGEATAAETPMARARTEDPNADKFLQFFYEHGVSHLLEPLTKGLNTDSLADLTLVQIALYTHLCDLLCFFVAHHSFRSKFFILSSNVSVKVAALLRAKPKHLRLAALRYFRACVGRNDDFYNRYLIKNDMTTHVLELTKQEIFANNLLSSACLELFEYLRVSNVKLILNELMTVHEATMHELAKHTTVIQGCISRWHMNIDPPPRESALGEEGESALDTSSETALPSSQPDHGSLTLEEEKYFDADDDDEEVGPPVIEPLGPDSSTTQAPLPSSQALRRSASSSLLSRFVGKTLSSSSRKTGDTDDDSNSVRKRQRLGDDSGTILPSGAVTGAVVQVGKGETASPSSAVAGFESSTTTDTDPEIELAKIREKRKREEDAEEEENVLIKRKSASAPGQTGATLLSRKSSSGSTSGKLKLLFGGKK